MEKREQQHEPEEISEEECEPTQRGYKEPLKRTKSLYLSQSVWDDINDVESIEEEEDEEEVPDLHLYFSKYKHIPNKNIIILCRSYASYLASTQKKNNGNKKKKI